MNFLENKISDNLSEIDVIDFRYIKKSKIFSKNYIILLQDFFRSGLFFKY